jgi:hypothetical protein
VITIRSARARQVVLVLTALVFLVIAAASLARPHFMAAGLGYKLESVDALSEFRAIYVGLWIATAGVLALAAARVDEPLLGDVGAVLILGQVLGRLISLVLDGSPSERIWPLFVLESLGGAVLLLIRPR